MATRIRTYEEYCAYRLNILTERLESFESLVKSGSITEQQYIKIANDIKNQYEFVDSKHNFYNYCVTSKNHFVVITEPK